MKGVVQKLGQGDSSVERQSCMTFERRTRSDTTVTTTDLVPELREAKHSRVQRAEDLVGGFNPLALPGTDSLARPSSVATFLYFGRSSAP